MFTPLSARLSLCEYCAKATGSEKTDIFTEQGGKTGESGLTG